MKLPDDPKEALNPEIGATPGLTGCLHCGWPHDARFKTDTVGKFYVMCEVCGIQTSAHVDTERASFAWNRRPKQVPDERPNTMTVADLYKLTLELIGKGQVNDIITVRVGTADHVVSGLSSHIATSSVVIHAVAEETAKEGNTVLKGSNRLEWEFPAMGEKGFVDTLWISPISDPAVEPLVVAFNRLRGGWVFYAQHGMEDQPVELAFLKAWAWKDIAATIGPCSAKRGNIIERSDGSRYMLTEDSEISAGERIVGPFPHFDNDYSYRCGREHCRCMA